MYAKKYLYSSTEKYFISTKSFPLFYGEKLYFLRLGKYGGNCYAIVVSYQETKWFCCFHLKAN